MRQIKLLAYLEGPVFVNFQGAGLMKNETHCNINECWCSMSVRGPMYILPGNSFHVYIANLTGKPPNLPKLMKGPSASKAPTSIIHVRDDDSNMLKDEGPGSTEYENRNSDSTFNTVRYKQPEYLNEKVDRNTAVRE